MEKFSLSQILAPLAVFCLMLAATGVGMFVNAKISERHWTSDVPYGGLFGVPGESMRNALEDMMR